MRRPTGRFAAPALIAFALILVACTPSPSPSPGPATAEEAVELVLEQEERFAGIGPLDPDLIGQAAWYEVAETNTGWQVVIRIGWGDCPAGCMNQHRWIYTVDRDGTVELMHEEGDPLLDGSGARGVVLRGPICPVVTDPPDPDCADQPVVGATLVFTTLDGTEVARATTDASGEFSVELAPGAYRLVAQPVEGLMGTPAPIDFGVEAGVMSELTVGYDTGIR